MSYLYSDVAYADVKFDTYRTCLSDGDVHLDRFRDERPEIPYDYGVMLSASWDGSLSVLFRRRDSVGIHSYTEEVEHRVSVEIYFTDSRKAPKKSGLDIYGTTYLSRPMIQTILTTWKATRHFANYMDILRHESPLFLSFGGRIDDTKSTYHKPGSTELVEIPEIRVTAKGCRLTITSYKEEVGEGESADDIIEAIKSVAPPEN